MMRTTLASAIALLLCALAPSSAAARTLAPQPEASPSPSPRSMYHPVHLTVDTTKLLDHQESALVDKVHTELKDQLTTLLSQHLKLVGSGDPDAVEITVSLAWINYDKSIYAVTLQANRPDSSSHEMAFEILGDHLGVIERLETDTSKLLGWAERSDDDTPAAVPGEPVSGDPDQAAEEQPTSNNDRERKLHALGWTGVALSVVGVGVGVAGGVLLPRKTTVTDFSGGAPGTSEEAKHPRALTLSLVGVGAVLAVTGVSLIIADVVRGAKKRGKSVSVSPMLDARRAGLQLVGKF